MIIGITSLIGGGKEEATKRISEKLGIPSCSHSDFLRNELKKQGKEITRKSLQDLGNELRAKYGNDYITLQLIESNKDKKSYIAESIRNPDEVNALKKFADFILIAVIADQRLRFERVMTRQREEGAKTFEEFKKVDEREHNDLSLGGMRILECIKMADFIIYNNGSLEELYAQLDELIEQIKKKCLI